MNASPGVNRLKRHARFNRFASVLGGAWLGTGVMGIFGIGAMCVKDYKMATNCAPVWKGEWLTENRKSGGEQIFEQNPLRRCGALSFQGPVCAVVTLLPLCHGPCYYTHHVIDTHHLGGGTAQRGESGPVGGDGSPHDNDPSLHCSLGIPSDWGLRTSPPPPNCTVEPLISYLLGQTLLLENRPGLVKYKHLNRKFWEQLRTYGSP